MQEANTYASVATTNTGVGTGAVATVIVAGTTAPTITSITLTNAGSGYVVGDVLTIAAGSLGTGQLITAQNVLGISNGAAYSLGAVTGPIYSSPILYLTCRVLEHHLQLQVTVLMYPP